MEHFCGGVIDVKIRQFWTSMMCGMGFIDANERIAMEIN